MKLYHNCPFKKVSLTVVKIVSKICICTDYGQDNVPGTSQPLVAMTIETAIHSHLSDVDYVIRC